MPGRMKSYSLIAELIVENDSKEDHPLRHCLVVVRSVSKIIFQE